MKWREDLDDAIETLDGISKGRMGLDPDAYKAIVDKAQLQASMKSYFYAKLSFIVSVIALIFSVLIFYIDNFIMKP